MGEERRQVHPQEPAEGSEEDVRASDAEKSGVANRETAEGLNGEERSSEHPQEPAEGGEEEMEAPGPTDPVTMVSSSSTGVWTATLRSSSSRSIG